MDFIMDPYCKIMKDRYKCKITNPLIVRGLVGYSIVNGYFVFEIAISDSMLNS